MCCCADLLLARYTAPMPTANTPMPVDTGKVTGRRTLRFDSPAEMEADVARLVEAERAGRLVRVGNWSPGQILNHLGAWATFAFEEHPLKPPFFVRWIVGVRQNK